jgi:hypothetical protein
VVTKKNGKFFFQIQKKIIFFCGFFDFFLKLIFLIIFVFLKNT